MKSLKFNLIVCTFLFLIQTSCDLSFLTESISGEGEVIMEERKVPDFDGIKVSSGIDVYLSQGSQIFLEVVADENLHDIIKTEVRNGILNVYSKRNIWRAKSKKVYVTLEEINSIKVTSAGDVKSQGTIKTDKLRIDLSSSGDLDLDVDANTISCTISSSGDANISGRTNVFHVNLSSAGDLSAYDLYVEKCEISVSSAGNARINVSEELEAKASSAGDIYYKGNPKIINTKTSSSGGIHKR